MQQNVSKSDRGQLTSSMMLQKQKFCSYCIFAMDFSTRDIGTNLTIMCRIFKDGELVKKMQISKTKVLYVIVNGIANSALTFYLPGIIYCPISSEFFSANDIYL